MLKSLAASRFRSFSKPVIALQVACSAVDDHTDDSITAMYQLQPCIHLQGTDEVDASSVLITIEPTSDDLAANVPKGR